jgi:hypothetical protein
MIRLAPKHELPYLKISSLDITVLVKIYITKWRENSENHSEHLVEGLAAFVNLPYISKRSLIFWAWSLPIV